MTARSVPLADLERHAQAGREGGGHGERGAGVLEDDRSASPGVLGDEANHAATLRHGHGRWWRLHTRSRRTHGRGREGRTATGRGSARSRASKAASHAGRHASSNDQNRSMGCRPAASHEGHTSHGKRPTWSAHRSASVSVHQPRNRAASTANSSGSTSRKATTSGVRAGRWRAGSGKATRRRGRRSHPSGRSGSCSCGFNPGGRCGGAGARAPGGLRGGGPGSCTGRRATRRRRR